MLETADAIEEGLPKHIQFTAWDAENSPPDELENTDVIILNDILQTGNKSNFEKLILFYVRQL